MAEPNAATPPSPETAELPPAEGESAQDRNWARLKESVESWRQRALDAEARLAGASSDDVEHWKARTAEYGQALAGFGVLTDDGELDAERIETLEQERQAVTEKIRDEMLAEAGFKPGSGEAIVLGQALSDGLVEPAEGQSIVEAVRSYADTVHGWTPKFIPTPAQEQMLQAHERLDRLNQLAHSEPPQNLDDEIAAAEAAGNHNYARQLKSRAVARNMLADRRRR